MQYVLSERAFCLTRVHSTRDSLDTKVRHSNFEGESMRRCVLLLLSFMLTLATVPAFAQPQIESAQADLYFPQIVTGGPTSAQWQTTFTFANPNPTTARCTLFLMGDGGQAFQMN